MKEKQKSFAGRLSLNILIFTSLIFLGALTFSGIFSHIILSEEAENSAKNLLHSTINQIGADMGRVEEMVKGASWLVEEEKDDEDYLYHITSKLVEDNLVMGSAIAFSPYYFQSKYYFSPYSFINAEGKIESRQLGNNQYDYFYMDWYQIPSLLGEPCWSEPYFDEGGGESLMTTYSYPLKDEEGKVFAVITADVSLQWISEALSEIKPYPNSVVSLVSRSGQYINVSPDSDLRGETLFSSAYSAGDQQLIDIAKAMSAGVDGISKYVRGGKASFAVYGPLPNKWSVGITCSYEDVLHRASRLHLITILIALLGLIVLFFVCRSLIKKLTKPINSVSEATLKIADGNFNIDLPEIKTGDEIQQLRDSIVFMEDSLVKYVDDLKESTAANERFENELGIASKIQMGMLSRNFPHTDQIGAHAILRPAKEVGGDLYDFFFKDNWFYFAIGDVSGKGIPASLFMAITKFAFRLLANSSLELDQVMTKLNNAVSEGNANGLFVTMFTGAINLDTGEFKYCNAGHNPIILNGEFLKAKTNIAVGVFENFNYEMESCMLEKGSKILAYTDGVTEAEKADKEQYTEARLLEWNNAHSNLPSSEEACESLYEDVKAFTEGNDQNDDITIMTIKFK